MRRFVAIDHASPPDGPAPSHPPSGPPGASSLAREARSVLQLGRLAARSPALRRAPRGDGGPVVVIPGWRSPEATMAPIRAYLRWLGHDAHHWGFGTNVGDPRRHAARLATRVEQLAGEAGRPVALVGWSLGGTIARATARRVPHAVSQVMTYGAPVIGGPVDTVGGATPIAVPITAIFTRRDRVVAWDACIDRRSPNVHHIEVASTHLGLGIDPDVWLAIAKALGAAPR